MKDPEKGQALFRTGLKISKYNTREVKNFQIKI